MKFRHGPRESIMLALILWAIGNTSNVLARYQKAGSVSVRDFGAKGDGVTDDRAAIQAAIDSVESGAVYFPPASGGYLITPTPDKKKFLSLKSKIQLIGIGNPVIRVAGSSAPYDSVFSAVRCDDCAIENLTIDSNIVKNPVKDKGEIYAHPRVELSFGGGHRIRIDHVTIKNSSSVNSIATGVPVSDIRITQCTFTGNGDDPNHTAHDRSELYIHASESAVIDSNTFTGVRRGAPAAGAAIETHGSGMSITGNVITDYAGGMNLTGVAPSDSIGNVVSGNTIRGALSGMGIWSNTYSNHLSGYGINGLSITGNTIVINQSGYTGAAWTATSTSGISIEPHSNLPITNLTIAGNLITFDLEDSIRKANSASMGIGWWSIAGETVENLRVENNTIENAPVAGIRLAAALKGCSIKGNIIRNAGSSLDTTIAEGYKVPVFIAGAPSTQVEITDNQIIDSLEPSRIRSALHLATAKGTSTGLRLRNNSVTIRAANRTSFKSHVEIADDNTLPLLTETWEDFAPPTKRVAPGSAINDSKNRARWGAELDGSIRRQR